MYKRLNGEGSNGNPIFINNAEYEYMVQGTEWYKLIVDHNWMYGYTTEYNTANPYNGNLMYGIETGKTAAKRFLPDEEQETCSDEKPCTEKEYTWSKSINAKIGLMYMYDVDYAYKDGNPGSKENVYNSWIHFRKDGYNPSPDHEWLITCYGLGSTTNIISARRLAYDGYMGATGLWSDHGIRPVFYLSSNAKIKDGSGTKVNPYILDVQ